MTIESRRKILEAAARVYAECGFRGATTRRIAHEAGVNEVTLFRIFGSKAALIAESLASGALVDPRPALPDEPVDPEGELTRWAVVHLAHLRDARSLILKTLGELEERPELADCAKCGPLESYRLVRGYLERLRASGHVDADVDPDAAAPLLLGTLFADAVGREFMPELYPVAPDGAAATYVRIFLRGIGYRRDQGAEARERVAPLRSGAA